MLRDQKKEHLTRMENPRCKKCGSELELLDTKIILDTEYKIWKCKKCKRMVAKSS